MHAKRPRASFSRDGAHVFTVTFRASDTDLAPDFDAGSGVGTGSPGGAVDRRRPEHTANDGGGPRDNVHPGTTRTVPDVCRMASGTPSSIPASPEPESPAVPGRSHSASATPRLEVGVPPAKDATAPHRGQPPHTGVRSITFENEPSRQDPRRCSVAEGARAKVIDLTPGWADRDVCVDDGTDRPSAEDRLPQDRPIPATGAGPRTAATTSRRIPLGGRRA